MSEGCEWEVTGDFHYTPGRTSPLRIAATCGILTPVMMGQLPQIKTFLLEWSGTLL